MGTKHLGSKYEETKDLDIKEIAKLVRKDLGSEFPDAKFGVRIQRYSGGQAIHIHINEWPGDDNYDVRSEARLKVAVVAGRYNKSESDPMSDYHSCRFYSFVHWGIR